jgi:hypothetical protein
MEMANSEIKATGIKFVIDKNKLIFLDGKSLGLNYNLCVISLTSVQTVGEHCLAVGGA